MAHSAVSRCGPISLSTPLPLAPGNCTPLPPPPPRSGPPSDHCALYERRDGLPRVRLFPLSRPQDAISLSLPHVQAGVCVLEPGANQHFSSSSLRLTLSSPLLPEAVLDVDLRTGAVAERRRTVIQGRPRVNAEDFEVSRLHVRVPAGGGGADAGGVRVPVTLVRRRGAPLDGSGPLLLSGYGAYGTTQEPAFSAEHLCLLRRGWTLATAHVRGGGELGKRWHVDGRGAAKRNTFSDFAAVASHLVQRGYCAQNRLAARGVSAGGLLAGVMANEAPEGLFSALVLRVPDRKSVV